MINPFTHTGKTVADWYTNANESDCAPGLAKIGVTIMLPLIVPTAFISALCQKGKGK